VFDRLIRESKELGTFFYVIAGGEPLLRKDLFDVFSKHKDVVFMLFTNGTLINEGHARMLSKLHNVATMFSVEGFLQETDKRRGEGVYEKVLRAMQVLGGQNLFYGFSTTVTNENINVVAGDEFYREMIKFGCRLGIYVEYIPSREGADRVLSDQERAGLRNKILQWRTEKKAFLFHLPRDEHELAGRCLSAGNGFLHVTSRGYIEPCPFVHFAAENINEKSFKDILRSPFLAALRERESMFSEGETGCGLFDNISEVKDIAGKHNAVNTLQCVSCSDGKIESAGA